MMKTTNIAMGVVIGMLVAGGFALVGLKPANAQAKGQTAEVSCACNAAQCCCGQVGSIGPNMSCK